MYSIKCHALENISGDFFFLSFFLQEMLRKELVDNGSKFNYPATKDGYLKIGKFFYSHFKIRNFVLRYKMFLNLRILFTL